MLQSSEKYLTEQAEEKAIRREQRLMSLRRRLFKAATFATLLGVGVSGYAADVRNNQALEASSRVEIDTIDEALNQMNDDEALVSIDGFRANDAKRLTESVGRAAQSVVDGQLWSVDYNNAGLSYEDIADQIIAMAKREKVTSVSLIGYSAGGLIAMRVLQFLYEKSDLTISSIFLVSVPDGVKDLREAQVERIRLIESLKWIPGIEHSTYLQIIGEMAIRSANFTEGDTIIENAQNFIINLNEVQVSIKNGTVPGTWVQFKQLVAIEKGDIQGRIEYIASLPNTIQRPSIYYLGTAEPGYDYMVNNKDASESIADYADPANIPYHIFNVPGAVHSRPELTKEEYLQTLADNKATIQNDINQQISIAYGNLLLQRYNPNGPPDANSETPDYSEPYTPYTPSPSATAPHP